MFARIDIGFYYPTNRAGCASIALPPGARLRLRGGAVGSLKGVSPPLSSVVAPDDGKASPKSLDGIFWHSKRLTSSTGMRIREPSRKQPSSPFAMALRITPSEQAHSAARDATV